MKQNKIIEGLEEAESHKYQLWDKVQKRKGYRWPGIIVCCFHTLKGKARYNVECVAPGAEGALHIFSNADLKRRR